MATLISLSGFQYGITADETAINIESISINSKPEFKKTVTNKSGTVLGFAVGEPMAEITVTGETTGTNGIVAAVATSAYVLANSVDQFGQTTGGCYADSLTITSNRDAFRQLSITFTRYKAVT